MPHRQVISGRVRLPMVSDVVIPFRAVTTFEEFEINTGRPIAFDLPLPAAERPRLAPGDPRGAPRLAPRRARALRRKAADSLRSWDYADHWTGGRYELHRPGERVPSTGYQGWLDSLSLEGDPAETYAARARSSRIWHAWLSRCPTR